MTDKHVESFNSIAYMNEINGSLNKFKEEILATQIESESRLNSKLTFMNTQFLQAQNEYELSMNSFNAKYDDISKSLAMVSVKFDRLNSFETFASKGREQIDLHEIRINNLMKEHQSACYKYDKIYMDNLLLPGFIGDCCKYRTAKDFFDDAITQLSVFSSFKDKHNNELKTYKDKLDSMLRSINIQVDSIVKNAARYTNDQLTEKDAKLSMIVKELNEQIERMDLSNNKYAIEMKKTTFDLNDELEKLKNIKEELMSTISGEIEQQKKSNETTAISFNEFKTEFNRIKKRFDELADFIKDVRFRKNLNAPIEKKEITTLVRSMNFKKRDSFEDNNDLRFIEKLKRMNGLYQAKKEDRLSLSQGASRKGSDAEHDEKNQEQHRRKRDSNISSMKNQNSRDHQGTNKSLTSQKDLERERNFKYQPEFNQPYFSQFDIRKEQKVILKRMYIVEKRMYDFEDYIRNCINEQTKYLTQIRNYNLMNTTMSSNYPISSNQGITYPSPLNVINVVNSKSSRIINTKPISIEKSSDNRLNISNKILPVTVVHLSNKNLPNINQSSNNNPIQKLHQYPRLKSGMERDRDKNDKFIMQTLGTNPNDMTNNKDNNEEHLLSNAKETKNSFVRKESRDREVDRERQIDKPNISQEINTSNNNNSNVNTGIGMSTMKDFHKHPLMLMKNQNSSSLKSIYEQNKASLKENNKKSTKDLPIAFNNKNFIKSKEPLPPSSVSRETDRKRTIETYKPHSENKFRATEKRVDSKKNGYKWIPLDTKIKNMISKKDS